MCVLLMLLATLLHATSTANALDCWVGMSARENAPAESKVYEAINVGLSLMECPASITHCVKLTCKLDTEALKEIAPEKACLPPEEKSCEIPEKGVGIVNGVDTNKIKNYCRMSCCTGNACNGTLGLRSFGTVAAMLAFIAAFFLRWN
uniref:Protein quiver n=1 Tax=Globodera rostochiensis TaxID=31243 RepID=A0A914HLW5_GLORO